MEKAVRQKTLRDALQYFLMALLAWALVDFTTTPAIAHPQAYYSKYLPALLLFYVGYPLVFSVLIYRFRLSPRKLFLAMIAGIVVVEILCTHNLLLLTLPVCLIAIPISLGHYGMVTFMPQWVAERTIGKNQRWAMATMSLWALGVFLNILTQFGAHPPASL